MKKIALSNGQIVEMREPKVKDMRFVKKETDEFEKEVALLCNLTQMTKEEIDDLSMKDFAKLDEALQGFLS